LEWSDTQHPSSQTGYVLAAAIVCQAVTSCISGSQYSLAWQRFDIRMRAGVMAALYERTMHLDSKTKQKYGIGRITNLMSVDLGRMIGIPGTIFDIFLIPTEVS